MTQKETLMLRPALSYAVWKAIPLMALSLFMLGLAWSVTPPLIYLSFVLLLSAVYRIGYVRSYRYLIAPDYMRVSQGIFRKTTAHVEMYRVKDYLLTQPFLMQAAGLMNLTLKTTDPENQVVALKGIPVSNVLDELRERVQAARSLNKIIELN